ncbi:MAG: DUF3035 domain-containing protein [Pseudomonadota bacterium]
MRGSVIVVLVAALAVSACARKDKDIVLTRLKDSGTGPNEFGIVPGKPLQPPENFTTLPTPTPGGSNITDPTPLQDSVAALGGNPNAVARTNTPSASDGALINHSRRFGAEGNIRQVLAAEDVDVRRRRGRVNIFNLGQNDDYTLAYKRQWLDSQAEEQRLRSLGIQTPSAPPAE